MIELLRGMKDVLPPESRKWELIQAKASEIFSTFGYRLSITPVLEKTELFCRSVGESSDIVSKEMYTFTDRGEESVTLRPEGTASIMRAYLNTPEYRGQILKTWYWGPMFRYERPQKGRYRQFFQYGLEAINAESPYVDAEIIYMLELFFTSLGVKGVVTEINTVGCDACRPDYRTKLVSYFESHKDKLCEDCKRRLTVNPLRLLDCKVESCAALVAKAPLVIDSVCGDCKDHFESVQTGLKSLGASYKINPLIVRGLDYYSKTVFEVITEQLGSRQNAVGGGGRYDTLSTQLGAPKIPSVGFAGGVERLAMLLDDSKMDSKKSIYIAFLDKPALNSLFNIAVELKKSEKINVIDEGFKTIAPKKHLAKADKYNADFALIAGENEVNAGELKIKNLKEHTEQTIKTTSADFKITVAEILKIIGG